MRTTPRTLAVAAAVVGAIVAAFVVPGVLVLAVGVALFFAIRHAVRAAEGRPSPRRRWLAALAVAAAIFAAASLVWLIALIGMTYECEFEEVRCSNRAEQLAQHGEWTFVPIAVVALAAGWLFTKWRYRA